MRNSICHFISIKLSVKSSINQKLCIMLRAVCKRNSPTVCLFELCLPRGPGLAGTRMSPFRILLKLRMMELVVTTGAVRRAKLQSNRHHQQTNTQLFTVRMPFLSPNPQCQSIEGKCLFIWTSVTNYCRIGRALWPVLRLRSLSLRVPAARSRRTASVRLRRPAHSVQWQWHSARRRRTCHDGALTSMSTSRRRRRPIIARPRYADIPNDSARTFSADRYGVS